MVKWNEKCNAGDAVQRRVIAMNTRIEEPYKPVILSAAKNLKTKILRCAQDDKLNLNRVE